MSGMAACICIIFLFVFAQSKGMLLGAEAIAAGIWALFSKSFSWDLAFAPGVEPY